MVVCSATAFLILSTGLYNIYDPAVNGVPDEARLLLANLPGVEAGPRFVQPAVESALPGFGQAPADRAGAAPGHHRHGGVRCVPQCDPGLGAG
ncbi:hypothetical protein G6F40_017524 [Rhizopus arrhizus]|nr:hypothetical protein G6F40_017524 [Rhizopus arrhizus]